MKRVTLVLIVLVLSLTACSSKNATLSDVTPTPTATLVPTPTKVPKGYDSIIAEYKTAINDYINKKISFEELQEETIGDNDVYSEDDYDAKTISYAIVDINKSGKPELYIFNDNFDERTLMTIYTLDKNDSPIRFEDYWHRNRCVVTKDGLFYIYENYSSAGYGYSIEKLNSSDKKLNLVESYDHDDGKCNKVVGNNKDKRITKKEFLKFQEKWLRDTEKNAYKFNVTRFIDAK